LAQGACGGEQQAQQCAIEDDGKSMEGFMFFVIGTTAFCNFEVSRLFVGNFFKLNPLH
jgi:hypothetical protein